MKTENILILAAVAVGGYFVYKKLAGSSTPPENFVTTTEYQGTLFPSIPILPPPSEIPQAQRQQQAAKETAQINFLSDAAKAGQTVLFTDKSGKTVGVQDAKLGMSYRIENQAAIMQKAAATNPATSSSIRTTIAGTPYSTTSSAIVAAANNPLSTAAANLKKKTLR